MKTIIVGGGLLGLSSALFLHLDGQEVELFESEAEVGMETSFANGGMLTPSMSDPWNAPGVMGHLSSSLFDPAAAMKLRLHAIPSLFFWGLRFLANSTEAKHRAATLANFNLAHYSVNKTLEVSEQFDLQYSLSRKGVVKVFHDQATLLASSQIANRLVHHGLHINILDVRQTVSLEPQLADIEKTITGAIHYPDDVSGDAHLFCCELRRVLESRGVKVHGGSAERHDGRTANSH